MKAYKVITTITVILLVAIISVASFYGIYKLKDYKVSNNVPKYILGMDFADSRVVNLKVRTGIESTKIYDKDGNEVIEEQEGIEYTEENGYTTVETKVNPDEKLTKENFKKAKNIIRDRLVSLGVEQYTIKQDIENGNIQIQMTESNFANDLIENIVKKGTFELVDEETKDVLIDQTKISSTNVVYGQTDSETSVYLQIKFNKEGKQKLEEISKTYIKTTIQTTNENGETEDSDVTKNVSILLNGQTYNTTYFGDTLTNGILNIPIGSSQDAAGLQQYMKTAMEMSIILNKGVLPIEYQETDYVLNNNIDLLNNKAIVYVVIGVLAIITIYSLIKLKAKGLLAVIMEIGYIGILLLTLRYTNIKITIEGLVGIFISVILNYIYIYKAFANSNLNFIKEITSKFALKLIPIYLIAIIFTFNSIASIYSLGMTLVWGIIIIYLYNLTLTQITVKTLND